MKWDFVLFWPSWNLNLLSSGHLHRIKHEGPIIMCTMQSKSLHRDTNFLSISITVTYSTSTLSSLDGYCLIFLISAVGLVSMLPKKMLFFSSNMSHTLRCCDCSRCFDTCTIKCLYALHPSL